jgi:hypothetical protein
MGSYWWDMLAGGSHRQDVVAYRFEDNGGSVGFFGLLKRYGGVLIRCYGRLEIYGGSLRDYILWLIQRLHIVAHWEITYCGSLRDYILWLIQRLHIVAHSEITYCGSFRDHLLWLIEGCSLWGFGSLSKRNCGPLKIYRMIPRLPMTEIGWHTVPVSFLKTRLTFLIFYNVRNHVEINQYKISATSLHCSRSYNSRQLIQQISCSYWC